MFHLKISYGSGDSFSITTPVMADRLPEVERRATMMLARVFPDIKFVMVHEGDLAYSVYPVDEPIARVQIETAGDYVQD